MLLAGGSRVDDSCGIPPPRLACAQLDQIHFYGVDVVF